MANDNATAVIYAEREIMIAEYGCFDWTKDGYKKPEECAFIISPVGPASYSEEYAATKEEAIEIAKSLSESWGNIPYYTI